MKPAKLEPQKVIAFYKDNHTIQQTAREFHTHTNVVKRILKDAGLTVGRRTKPKHFKCLRCGGLNTQSRCFVCERDVSQLRRRGKLVADSDMAPKMVATTPRLITTTEAVSGVREYSTRRSSQAITWG